MASTDSHPRPWSLKNLNGKYYGTEIIDARGRVIPGIKIWFTGEDEPSDMPSVRETEDEDMDWTHYENVACYELAKLIVDSVNKQSP